MVGGSVVPDSRLAVLALPRLLGARGRVDPGVAEYRMGRLDEAPSRSLERWGAPRGGACGGLLRVLPDSFLYDLPAAPPVSQNSWKLIWLARSKALFFETIPSVYPGKYRIFDLHAHRWVLQGLNQLLHRSSIQN